MQGIGEETWRKKTTP